MLSVVIPAFSANDDLMSTALRCAEDVRDQADELIITDDSDIYYRELHKIADIYTVHPRLGYTKNLNLGWRMATGDYVLHISADCKLLRGNIRDLCIPGAVVSPRVQALDSDPPWGRFNGACFVVPRSVMEKIGMFNEGVDWRHNPDLEYAGRLNNKQISIGNVEEVAFEHAASTPGPFVRAIGSYSGRQGS